MMKRIVALAVSLLALAACGKPKDAAPAENNTAPASAAASQTATPAVERPHLSGAEIFAKQCSYCHAPGDDHPGTLQLRVTRGEQFALLEEREDLTADYVKYIVRHGLNGMPPFTPSVITDAELDLLAAHLAKAE